MVEGRREGGGERVRAGLPTRARRGEVEDKIKRTKDCSLNQALLCEGTEISAESEGSNARWMKDSALGAVAGRAWELWRALLLWCPFPNLDELLSGAWTSVADNNASSLPLG